MGHFIDMAAVLAPPERVGAYLAEHPEDGSAACVSKEMDKTLVIYKVSSGDFGRVRRLSQELRVAVFALHLHDDALWLYELYASGVLMDRFNPIPHYWEELSEEETASWRGKPEIVAAYWPGVSVRQIERYLCTRDDSTEDADVKAYGDDEFGVHDCWQVCDFLRKLGTPYPE